MSQSPYRNHPCYRAFGLEAYIAAPVIIQGRTFGTLNFSSPDPRPHPFTDTEITFVTLLTKWLASLLEGQITARTLTKLVRQAPGMLYQYRQWPDGRSAFPYTSPGIRDIYGCSPEEVAEDASRVFERIHPDDLPAVAESIQTSSTHLSTWQHQYRVRSDRGWRWVEGRATPEKLADNSIIWHGYITDIDDKKRTQLALQESEAQLRRLFELSPIGIALNDLHTGAFLAVNDALLAPTGYHREQFLGLHPSALMAGDFPAFRSQVMRELNDTGRFGPYELTITRHDRSHYPALVQGLVIKGDAGQTLIWTLVEDISERKKVERMKNEFISSVSHELRTPLTSIAGSLGLIASGALGQLPDKVAQMVQIAARNSDQLKHLINDLLDMEKLVSGRIRMSIEPAPLFPVLAEAVEQLRTYAMDRRGVPGPGPGPPRPKGGVRPTPVAAGGHEPAVQRHQVLPPAGPGGHPDPATARPPAGGGQRPGTRHPLQFSPPAVREIRPGGQFHHPGSTGDRTRSGHHPGNHDPDGRGGRFPHPGGTGFDLLAGHSQGAIDTGRSR